MLYDSQQKLLPTNCLQMSTPCRSSPKGEKALGRAPPRRLTSVPRPPSPELKPGAGSEFRPPARDFKKGPHPEPGCALWRKARIFVGPCGAGNIQVHPRDMLRHELLEKNCPDDCPRASVPNVLNVRHIAFQSFQIEIPERQRPEPLPNCSADLPEWSRSDLPGCPGLRPRPCQEQLCRPRSEWQYRP